MASVKRRQYQPDRTFSIHEHAARVLHGDETADRTPQSWDKVERREMSK